MDRRPSALRLLRILGPGVGHRFAPGRFGLQGIRERARLFEHLQKLSLGFYSHYSVGRVITRVINDVGVLREFLTWNLLLVLRRVG